MSTLHTVNKSSFTHNTLASCIDICIAGDSILFIEDGIFSATKNNTQLDKILEAGISLYALKNDTTARGLNEKLHTQVQLADYSDFVKLSAHHLRVQSWY